MMLIKSALPAFTSSEKSCSERFTSCAQQTFTVRLPFTGGGAIPETKSEEIGENVGVQQRLFGALCSKGKDEYSNVAGRLWVHRSGFVSTRQLGYL